MKTNAICLVLIVLVFACNKNTTEPEPEKVFWTSPLDDAIRLYFRISDSVQVDSILAGKIQYRLDLAKTVDENLLEFSVLKDWVLGEITLFTSDALYSSFDTTTFRFNYQPLDSLLRIYELKDVYKKRNRFKLIFPVYYNMRVLSESISKIEGVNAAEPNRYGTPGICDKDISLEINGDVYKFIFSETDSCARHFWEVHVIDDHAEFVAEWK